MADLRWYKRENFCSLVGNALVTVLGRVELQGNMSDADEPSAQATLEDFSSTHRIWVLPILRTLTSLGGSASPRDVVATIRETVASGLSLLQWARVLHGKHIRWTRVSMKEKGLIAGEHGKWDLTEAGTTFLQALKDVPATIPDDLPELS